MTPGACRRLDLASSVVPTPAAAAEPRSFPLLRALPLLIDRAERLPWSERRRDSRPERANKIRGYWSPGLVRPRARAHDSESELLALLPSCAETRGDG